MDWSDEVRARLVREEERLWYKAANLQARGKTVMAAQELVVADDIRAALGEIERLRANTCDTKAFRDEEARAEEAEAKLAEAQGIANSRDRGWAEETRLRKAAEAEVERLREALESGLDLTQSWSDVRTHDWRNKARAALGGER